MDIRNNKGITLMAEVITVLLLVLIVSIITYSSTSSLQVRKLNNMYADIVTIQEKAQNYYLKYGKAPITDEKVQKSIIESISQELNPNDDSEGYYKVDVSNLNNITLNNKQDDNYYFINTKTLTVYYSKGVEIKNSNDGSKKIYHTLPSNKVQKLEVSDYQ